LHIQALREAMRLSVREFAAYLGVSDRMVSKWEANTNRIHPRPVNQHALDTCLTTTGEDTRIRFTSILRLYGIEPLNVELVAVHKVEGDVEAGEGCDDSGDGRPAAALADTTVRTHGEDRGMCLGCAGQSC
jgi:transcriptional regulator with XRE-family HTH domain